MIQLSFIQGGELMGLKISSGNIMIRGRMSSYHWIDYRDLKSEEISNLKKKFGDKWAEEYREAQRLRNEWSDEKIADDFIADLQKAGWRLAKKSLG